MSDTRPGADELRMRHILKTRGVGPDAIPPAEEPTEPTERPRDWLDDILDSNTTPATPPSPAAAPVEKAPAEEVPPRRRARPAYRDTERNSPRQSLLDAWDQVPGRLKWLIFHGTAAAAGWRIGWVDWATDTAAWYAAGHWVSPSAWVLYGLGGLALGLYRSARSWAWPVAWLTAIPVSSTVVGVLLYGTGYHP